MKKIFYLFLSICLLSFYACDEIPPNVTNMNMGGGGMGGGDNSIENQERQVLIEEFTGVRCINCPAGSTAIENLLDANGERLVAVSLHAGFFSPPYDQNLFDFQTSDGDNILNYVGQPQGFPTAVVNRKQFQGEDDLQINQSAWAGTIATDLQEPPKVKIGVDHTYDPGNRQLDATVTLYPQETIDPTNDPRITLMITESGVVDHQLTPQSSPDTDPNYVHKHILRDVITNFDGNQIADALTAGSEVVLDFTYSLSEDWNPEKCELIIFVNNNGLNKEVLQAIQTHVVE